MSKIKKHQTKGLAGLKTSFKNYRQTAKKRNLDYCFKFEDHVKMIKQNCFYCGNLPTRRITSYNSHHISKEAVEWGSNLVNGLDRVNNSKGYIKGNVVTCCTQCNVMKSNYTKKEFLDHVKKIAAYTARKTRT